MVKHTKYDITLVHST